MNFNFRKKAGKIEYLNRPLLKDYMASLKDGKYVISIEKEYRTRTSRENRYYWGVVLKTIAADTGYTTDEVHAIFGEKYLSYEKNGHKFIRSTTKLKTVEFEEYLEQVRRFAAIELGIVIPDPNQGAPIDTHA